MMRTTAARRKLSVTVAPETFELLVRVATKRSVSIGYLVDLAVSEWSPPEMVVTRQPGALPGPPGRDLSPSEQYPDPDPDSDF